MNMSFNEQYQADLHGDGYSNEYQRAYAESRLNYRPVDERDKAAILTAAGYSVVCGAYEATCPVTDAVMGYDILVVKACATIEEAREWESRCDHRFIFQAPEAPEPEPNRFDEDEIPF